MFLPKKTSSRALLAFASFVLGSGCTEEQQDEVLPPERCTGTEVLDVLPGQYPNEVDLSDGGDLEVAVLTTRTFDASTLAPGTATLTDADGTAPEVPARDGLELRDVDEDGRADVVLRFPLPTLVKQKVLHADISRLRLSAKTRSDTQVGGCDRAHASGQLLTRLPAPTGPYEVGTTDWHWVDTSRDEPVTPELDDTRELMVRAWYPASTPPRAQPAPYFPRRREGAARALLMEAPASLFDFVHAHAVADAPLASTEARYPVLLFSPGLGSSTALYTALLEELASHGYVVVAISHTFSTGPVSFPDGRLTLQAEAPDMNGLLKRWTADARFVLAQLRALAEEDPSGRFTGRLDLERVGMLGHSFGGATASLVCQREPGVRACANLDGSFIAESAGGTDQPFLLMTAGGQLDSSQTTFAGNQRGGGYQVSVKGARHLSFSDYPLLEELVKHHQPAIDLEVGSLGTRGPVVMNAYTLAFFDTYVHGREADLLSGPSGDYPEATVTRWSVPAP